MVKITVFSLTYQVSQCLPQININISLLFTTLSVTNIYNIYGILNYYLPSEGSPIFQELLKISINDAFEI